MSTLPSETSGPNREATSSGGTAEPTFHVTMCTLSARRDALKVKAFYTYWCGDERENIICACNPRRNKLSTALLHIGRKIKAPLCARHDDEGRTGPSETVFLDQGERSENMVKE